MLLEAGSGSIIRNILFVAIRLANLNKIQPGVDEGYDVQTLVLQAARKAFTLRNQDFDWSEYGFAEPLKWVGLGRFSLFPAWTYGNQQTTNVAMLAFPPESNILKHWTSLIPFTQLIFTVQPCSPHVPW